MKIWATSMQDRSGTALSTETRCWRVACQQEGGYIAFSYIAGDDLSVLADIVAFRIADEYLGHWCKDTALTKKTQKLHFMCKMYA